jgi:hypothetical protein
VDGPHYRVPPSADPRCLGFREPTVADEDALAAWLARDVCPAELSEQGRREALMARCRAERIEPPTPRRVERVLASARSRAASTSPPAALDRLSADAVARLEALATADRGVDGRGMLAELKPDPGPLGLPTLLRELDKLDRLRAVGLAPGLVR